MKQPGKRAQLFVAEETSYGTPPTIAASHAMRHITCSMDYDPFNRTFSPEKKAGPGRFARFDRRATAAGTLEGLIRPSGTLNTLPECSAILKAAFGSVANPTLSTTTASDEEVDGCTLTSATGLAMGDPLLITCPDTKKRVRFIQTVNTGTGAVTWAPDLPAAPSNGAAVKSGIGYKLTAANAISLWIARYTFEADFTAGLGELLKGWMVDRLSLMFPNIDEPKFTAGGAAQEKTDAAAHPGGFTQVGTNPPSALAAEALIDAVPINLLQLGFELTNGFEVRNDELGEAKATEAYRMGDRDITVSLDMVAENDYKTAVYDKAMAGTDVSLFKQVGFTEGKIIAVYAPRVEFKAPTVDVPDDAVRWPLRGAVLEPVEDGNGEFWLGIL